MKEGYVVQVPLSVSLTDADVERIFLHRRLDQLTGGVWIEGECVMDPPEDAVRSIIDTRRRALKALDEGRIR